VNDHLTKAKSIRNSLYTQLPIAVAKQLDTVVGQLIEENAQLKRTIKTMKNQCSEKQDG